MSGPRIAYVLGTSSGGTGAHVAMLAAGCAARGATVTVYGPASAGERFFTSTGEPKGRAAVWTDERGGEGAGARREDGGLERSGGERGPERAVAFEPVEIAGRVRPARDAAAVLRLRRLLRRAEPGVVHAHGLRAGALAAAALSLAARPRPALLVTVHNAPPAGRTSGLVYGLLERVIARRADAVTWVSGDLAARLRRLGARDGGRALVPAPPGPAPTPAQAAAARAGLGG
ncbi:MAG: glycosyltransferase, partial [Gemmatimonadota bacterium]